MQNNESMVLTVCFSKCGEVYMACLPRSEPTMEEKALRCGE